MLIERWNSSHDSRVAALEKVCFDYPWSEEMVVETSSLDNFFGLVLTEDGVVYGYAGAVCAFDVADVALVAVSPDRRRRGLGFAVTAALCDELEKRGIREIFLEVRASNLSAIGLYEKCGFKAVGLRKKYYEDAEDAIVMVKSKQI